MLYLLFIFALYTLEMWAIGYLAPKTIIETVYKQSGTYITWLSALFARICILLGVLGRICFYFSSCKSVRPSRRRK